MRREEERLRHGVDAQAEELAAALALPVWNIDRAQIDKILDSQGKTPPVEAVVVEAAGKIQARARDRAGHFVPSDGNVSPAGLLVAEQNHHLLRRAHRKRVALRHAALHPTSSCAARSISMALTTLAINLLLILSVYLVLWRAVVRPLTGIEKYAAAVSGGASDAPLAPVFPKELASVQSSIEMMVRLLEERYGQLQESGERFRSIFDAVNDAIVINDIDSGAILDANAAMCAMFGYTVEELRSIGIGPLSAGELSFTAADALARIRKAAAGEKQLFEWHSRHKDGHLFWTEVNLHVATIGDRRRSIVVVRDITQRKQMEEALKEEKDFTDTAINAMTGIFFVQDRQWRFVRWNDALEQLAARAGRTVEESGGGALVHPDDRDLVAEKIEEVFDRGFAHIEARIVLGDDVRYFFLNARRMDVDGEPFLVGTGFDVTDRTPRRGGAETVAERGGAVGGGVEGNVRHRHHADSDHGTERRRRPRQSRRPRVERTVGSGDQRDSRSMRSATASRGRPRRSSCRTSPASGRGPPPKRRMPAAGRGTSSSRIFPRRTAAPSASSSCCGRSPASSSCRNRCGAMKRCRRWARSWPASRTRSAIRSSASRPRSTHSTRR